MKPKTKFDFEVVRLKASLPPVTGKQIEWAYSHCIDHIGHVSKKGITCLDCFHTWDEKPLLLAKLDGCICPGCGRKLKVDETRRRVFKDRAYYGITTTHKGFQVYRIFDVKAKLQSNKHAEYSCHEIVQRWMSNNGKYIILSVSRYSCFGYDSEWHWWEDMEIRNQYTPASTIVPYKTYPAVRYIPEIKRNGYKGNFHGMNPLDFFSLILSSNESETLLKCGEIEWFKFFSNDTKSLKKCWPALRMVLRHKLKIKDKNLWKDYIGLLIHFGKDIRNPKVICPDDLHKEHDRYVRKKRTQDAILAREKRLKKIAEEEADYAKLKGKYFGIEFTDGIIQVRVLSSVQEVMEEGDSLHHCIYTNNYYKKAESLLLSALINGERLETIEVDIRQKRVVQCRGKYNQNTEYHDRIISLVNKNMHLIRKKASEKVKDK